MNPKTPSAIDSGLIARSAFAASIDVTYKWPLNTGLSRASSFSTAGMSRLPPASCNPVLVDCVQHAVSRRVSAGENSMKSEDEASTSSAMIALLNTPIPTTVMFNRRWGWGRYSSPLGPGSDSCWLV